MNRIDSARRSENTRRIRSRDTYPELIVRRALLARGLRFHLHRVDLPGQPDIVLLGRRLVILEHGCFWHCHEGYKGSAIPTTRTEFWLAKLDTNVTRDTRLRAELEELGRRVEVIWECTARTASTLNARLDDMLDVPTSNGTGKTISRRNPHGGS